MGTVEFRDLVPQAAEQLCALDSALNDEQQLRVIPRLLEILKKTDFVDRLNRGLFVGVTGQQDTSRFGLQLLCAAQQLNPVQLRHQIVADHDINGKRLQRA